jgi:adenosylcobinamide-GDP ribazoletransferase
VTGVRELQAAVALLTRLPVGAVRDGRVGAAAFPVAGLLVGALAAIPVLVVGTAEPVLAAILAVGVLAVVTGGLHLDGLADTTDALMAPDPERAEAARRDPRVGAGAVVAIVLVIAAEVAAISSLAGGDGSVVAAGAVVVAATVSRAVPVVAARSLRSRVPATGAGFGTWFADRVSPRDTTVAVGAAAVTVASTAVALGLPALALLGGLGGAVGVALAWWIAAARGRLDGDALGASVELAMAGTLVLMAVALPG